MTMSNEESTPGRRLAYYRSQRDMTQQDLADATGLTKRMVEKYEADNVLPSLTSFALIVKVLAIPADFLLPHVSTPPIGGTDA